MARVCHYYPGEFRGGDIPGPLFFLLVRQLEVIRTEARVELTQGVWIGQGLFVGSETAQEIARGDREEVSHG